MGQLEELERIIALMDMLHDLSDIEIVHSEADGLLLEALRVVTPPRHKLAIEILLKSYEIVDKWYS